MEQITCPHCGAHELEGIRCAYCGSQLLKGEPEDMYSPFTEKDSYTIPVGEYVGCNCNVVLQEDAIVVRQFVIGQKGNRYNTRIPYNQIDGVFFYRPEYKWAAIGHIIIRWAGNRNVAYVDPRKYNGTLKQRDEQGLITFDNLDEQIFYQIYCFVKSVAPGSVTNAIFTPSANGVGKEAFSGSVDFEGMFKRYSPYRDVAIRALCKSSKMDAKLARVLVDADFDQRQTALYAERPPLAIRDLNRVVRKAIKEKQKWTVKL